MLAEIITIGDEILIGQVVDTNSAWMASKLNDAGIRVKQITSVSDERTHILEALAAGCERADVLLITGGLGPTKDDITKKTLAEYFGVGFKSDEATLEQVRKIFARNNRPLLEVNIRQADVPENCTVLLNKNGTAPGMWFEYNGKIIISMPGVPFEMMYLVEEEVIPRLKVRFELSSIVHHTMLTAGVGESFLAEEIADIEDSLPAHIKLAYLPKLGQVRLRLSGYGESRDELTREIGVFSTRIRERVGDFVVTDEDKPLEKALLDLMESKRLTLSVAESCTGGYLSHLITQHPGCSSVFVGGTVTYSNQLKQSVLGVLPETLAEKGAVSQETVTEMAEGARKNFGSDFAVAISGVAGPDGGTPQKPVGTVWVAVAGKNETVTKLFKFGNRRAQNIERAAVNAIILLLARVKGLA
ncbi:competence/damage-inducible protein A [Hufsiella ginkgonis]|uniref:CinA-like protein n=1 Tax=Hufsiella ginkgonis TaxID=2695274 RepID=A0A7K1XWA7_9SPHI|nr:competence/damage-inducible protein A [Hufsiella ginkgonis]MXV15261.1 competence/damage-inducible protein A [Hufsiella ginkgonis]